LKEQIFFREKKRKEKKRKEKKRKDFYLLFILRRTKTHRRVWIIKFFLGYSKASQCPILYHNARSL